MTTMTSRMCSNFSQIQTWTAELAALEYLEKKIPIDLQVSFLIFFILAGNKDMHRNLDGF